MCLPLAQIATGLDDFSGALDDIQELNSSGVPIDADLEELASNLNHIKASAEADWNRSAAWKAPSPPQLPHGGMMNQTLCL